MGAHPGVSRRPRRIGEEHLDLRAGGANPALVDDDLGHRPVTVEQMSNHLPDRDCPSRTQLDDRPPAGRSAIAARTKPSHVSVTKVKSRRGCRPTPA